MKETLKISFDILESLRYTSVTDYCRYLVDTMPEDKLDFNIEVYRGDMLCLTVSDIKKAAKLMPTGTHWIKYDKSKKKRVEDK